MTPLIVGLVLFLGIHSTRIVAEGLRGALIARLGTHGWRAMHSVVSIAGLVLLAYGYGLAREAPAVLFVPPPWMRHVTALLMIPAFVLLAAAYVPGTRIKRAVGHPMVAGVKLWAFAHLLSNGTLADVVLFGAFLVWAVFDYGAARRRDRRQGRVYPTGPVARDAAAVAIGLAAYALFAFWLHAWWIGVRPFG